MNEVVHKYEGEYNMMRPASLFFFKCLARDEDHAIAQVLDNEPEAINIVARKIEPKL